MNVTGSLWNSPGDGWPTVSAHLRDFCLGRSTVVEPKLNMAKSAPRRESRGPITIDAADVQGSLDGNEDAFRHLVERYQQPVGNFLWKFTRNSTDWDELLQTVFVEAYVSLRTFRGDGPFLGWLRGIATHVVYRHWAERKRQVELTAARAIDLAVKGSATPQPPLGLFELLQFLPPRDRLILTLIYVDEQSVAEAAQVTGWSESLVKVQSHRARQKLKVLWKRHHGE